MPRKSPEERIAQLREEEGQIKAERRQLEAQVRKSQKKAYDRKCYLLGDLALKHMSREAIADLVDKNASDPEVRKLFEV